MNEKETKIISIVFAASALIMAVLLLSFLEIINIGLGATPLVRNMTVFFALLFITAAAAKFLQSVKKNEKTYYLKNLYNNILENTDIGLAILDEENRLEFANSQFLQLLSMEDIPVSGRNAASILPKCVYRFIMEYRLMPDEQLAEPVRQTITFKDLHIQYTIFRIKDDEGKYKFIATAQNQTEHIHMEEKLQEQLSEIKFYSDAKDSLLANVSHELKTPLNAIIGLNHILEGTNLSKQQKEIVGKINTSSDFLLSLINDVLDFSKIKKGSLSMNPSHFKLENLILDMQKIFDLTASQKNIDFDINYEFDHNLCLHLDRVRLEQVLVNLINNACKFTDIGYVKLNVNVLQELQETITLKFCVEDTGIGVDYEDIPSMFTEFHQLENHLTKLHQGTGLGLPICKHLVENMGGSLWVESTKNVGSSFFFTITAPKYYDSTEEESVQPFIPTFSGNGEKVLVVEDTLINYEVVEELLAAVNISCDHAADGFAAINACKPVANDYYKAILMDVHMPQMDGYETSQHLRDAGVTSPILILTASNIDKAITDKYGDLLSGFIQKPFKHTQLYDTLRPYFEDITNEGGNITSIENPFIGRDKAIENFGGNIEFYEKHLNKFKNRYVDSDELLKTHLRKGEYADARILSHSIKGLAGMLGLSYLETAAANLETAISDEDDNLRAFVSLFCDKLKKVMAA